MLLHEQNRFIWFLAFSQQKTYELPASVSYDEELFEQKIDSLKCLQDNVEPEDAYIKENWRTDLKSFLRLRVQRLIMKN